MNYITLEIDETEGQVIQIGELYEALKRIKDKRQDKGKRYTIEILLMVVILAKLCGEDKPYGMSEWVRHRAVQLQNLFGYHRQVSPSNKTLQRLMDTSVEDENVQVVTRQFLLQTYGGGQSLLITIDGKTLRGTIPKGKTKGVHLLAAYLPEEGVVLLQIEVGEKENEIVAAPKLLSQLDLKGRIVSGDAMFTQRKISVEVLASGGDYLWFVKDNQEKLHEDVQRFFQDVEHAPGWNIPPLPQAVAQTTTKQSGRIETRRLTAIPDEDNYIQWPGLQTVFKLERHVQRPVKKEASTQIVFGITSRPFSSEIAQQLLAWTRNHWGIENKLHYRRDVTLEEDDTRMKHTHQAQVLATLNNFVVALAKHLGFSNLAAARRSFQARFDQLIFSTE